MISKWASVRSRTLRLAALSIPLASVARAQEPTPVPLPDVVVQGSNESKAPAKKSVTKSKQKLIKTTASKASAPKEAPPLSDGSSAPRGSTDGYVAKTSTAGTKTDTPLQEVPQSISTVTRQQLEDRKPATLGDALAYVPGVRINQSGYDPRFDTFYIRGFDATYTGIYRDGMRQLYSPFGQFKTEPYGLESISIIRGPSSALYGAGNAGGIVDLQDKRPTETPFHEIEFLAGSYDRFQGNFDFSGPTAAGSDVLYRFTGVVRDSDTQAMGVPDDRLYLAPALTFKIDPDTKLTVLGEYMDAKTGGNMAWYNDYSSGHAQRTNIWSGDPAFNDFDQTQERIGYELEHRVNSDLILRQKARYEHLDALGEYIDVQEETSPGIWSRADGIALAMVNTVNTDNQAEMHFETGPVKHVFLAGTDTNYINYREKNGYTDEGVPPLVNYNYGQQYIPRSPINDIEKQNQFDVGTYLQDQIKLDRWVLTLSGRHDWVHTRSSTTADGLQSQDATAWSQRYGLTYLFDSGLAPYVAYGTSFAPNAGFDFFNKTPFDPTTSESKEVGFKYQLPGLNASINSAVFDIQQQGGLVTVYNDLGESGAVQHGKLRSRGFEIEGTTTLDNGLSLLASYSYVDMRIEDNEEGNEGNILSSTPRNLFSAWGDYTLRSGPAIGLGFGLGIRYTGSSFGNDENTFRNESTTLFDAAMHYDLAKLDTRFRGALLQVNVSNIFDIEKDVCSSDYCYLDQGRLVIGSLRYRW